MGRVRRMGEGEEDGGWWGEGGEDGGWWGG